MLFNFVLLQIIIYIYMGEGKYNFSYIRNRKEMKDQEAADKAKFEEWGKEIEEQFGNTTTIDLATGSVVGTKSKSDDEIETEPKKSDEE